MKTQRRDVYCYRVVPLFFAVCLLAAAGLSACSGGNQPASVDVGGQPERADADSQPASLDAGGSVVELVAVKVEGEDAPDGLASALYTFDPGKTPDQPVTVTIPVRGDAPDGDPDARAMLGIGFTVAFENGSSETLYQYVEATVADGSASATFTPSAYAGNNVRGKFNQNPAPQTTPSGEKLVLGIFWCSTTFENGGHFLVNFPARMGKVFINHNDRVAFLNDLEAVYNSYLGKNYAYSERDTWPMEVNVQRLDHEGVYAYGSDGAQGKININRSFFENGYRADLVKPLLAHEFFHFVQLNYATSYTDNLWFDEATATYFESKALGAIPSIYSEYKERLYTGVIPAENTSADGYARVPVIQFQAKTKSENVILRAYENVKQGNTWDFALTDALGDPSGWAGDFYAALVKGEVGNDAPYTLHKNVINGDAPLIGKKLPLLVPLQAEREALSASGEDAVLGKTDVSVGAFGAQLVALTIDDTNTVLLDESDAPVVRVSDGADAHVFEIRGNQVTDIPRGDNGFPLEGLKDSVDAGKVYLVLVTGLHASGEQVYTVSVEIPDASAAGRTNSYSISRTLDIYNKQFTVSESFTVTSSALFTVLREVQVADIVGIDIKVDNRNSDVAVVMTGSVSNPAYAPKLSNLINEGFVPRVVTMGWDGGEEQTLTVTIPKGAACGEMHAYSIVIQNYKEKTGFVSWGGSAGLFQVSIGCMAR